MVSILIVFMFFAFVPLCVTSDLFVQIVCAAVNLTCYLLPTLFFSCLAVTLHFRKT